MSVRKRVWGNRKNRREAWIVDYADQFGKRRHRTFERKGDADAFAASTHVQVREGTHDNTKVTIKEAGDIWLAQTRAESLEQTTIDQYEQHLRLHIVPFIGREKLSSVTIPFVAAFRERIHQEGRSAAMIRGVMGSLGQLLAVAQERGLVVRNAVREARKRRSHRDSAKNDRRNGKLKMGIDIPTPDEIRVLLAAAQGRWRPFLLTAVFTGLRASELRGLRWEDVDLKKGELHVRQRADRYKKIGPPKSAAGERTVPLPPTLLSELRRWHFNCPKKDGKLGLVFPNGVGNVELHGNIVKRGLIPTMLAAKIVVPKRDESGNALRDDEGRPILLPKYTGLHTLRHFFASWCINRKQDRGLELPGKVVQERLGHASITMTLDTYGHLFPRCDDTAELAAAEQRLIG